MTEGYDEVVLQQETIINEQKNKIKTLRLELSRHKRIIRQVRRDKRKLQGQLGQSKQEGSNSSSLQERTIAENDRFDNPLLYHQVEAREKYIDNQNLRFNHNEGKKNGCAGKSFQLFTQRLTIFFFR